MQVEEFKQKITTLSDSELTEVETFIQRVRNDRAATPPASVSFEEASEHVRNDYPHLLHQLSQQVPTSLTLEQVRQIQTDEADANRQTKALNAKREIFTEYDSLLSDLAE